MTPPDSFIKSLFVTAFSQAANTEPFKNNVLYFLTPSGFVTGKTVSIGDFLLWRKDNDSRLFNAATQPIEEALEQIEDWKDAKNEYVCLKDVKIYISNKTISMPYFVLFLEQIIGVYTASPQPL